MKIIINNKGTSLINVMFILIAMMLSAILLINSNDMSLSASGNMSYRAEVLHNNEKTIAVAMQWLEDNKQNNILDNDNINQGYFSSYSFEVDFNSERTFIPAVVYKNVDHENNENGIVSYYLIYRLCSLPNISINGEVAGIQNECNTESIDNNPTSNTGSSFGFNNVNYDGGTVVNKVFYKIIVKTVGLKGATVVTETVVKV